MPIGQVTCHYLEAGQVTCHYLEAGQVMCHYLETGRVSVDDLALLVLVLVLVQTNKAEVAILKGLAMLKCFHF
jgi:hypothetical protein